MGVLPALCICLLLHQFDGTKGQPPPPPPFGGEESMEGLLAPRSNVVMQSVVLGRRPCLGPGAKYDSPGLGLLGLVRYLLRTVLPLAYKSEEGSQGSRDIDTESIDPDILDRMMNIAKKKLLGKDNEDGDESVETERLVELDSERDKTGKLMRAREGRRRRGGYWRRHRHYDSEDDGYTRRKSPRSEEEDVGRRWRNRRTHRRRSRSWEDIEEDRQKKAADEERQKKAFEAEWETPHKDWSKKSQEGREVIYLPPPFPQSRHLLRPRPEDYIK